MTTTASGVLLHVDIGVGDPTSAVILGRGFTTTWEPGGACAEARLDSSDVDRLSTFISALRRGEIDSASIREAAPALGRLLGTNRVQLVGNDIGLLELVADTPAALTDIPWEAAARGSRTLPDSPSEIFEQLLAPLPICRLVPGRRRPLAVGDHRPRLLLCISNPPGIDGGQIAVMPIRTACEQVLQLYPAFQVGTLIGELTWSTVAPVLGQFQPNVLVVVGHGSSDPAGGTPTLAFVREGDPGGIDRVPVAEVAQAVMGPRSCGLVVLIACDLVRASGYSAAYEFVRQGAEEVVAMQGSIEQQCARLFLGRFLSEVLAGAAVPAAAASARQAAKGSLHAILPTVFRSSGRERAAGEIARVGVLYGQALNGLQARVRETEPMLERRALHDRLATRIAASGVISVGGGLGNGTSVAIRAAVTSALGERGGSTNRPIVYLDCDKRPRNEPIADWTARELQRATAAAPVMLPKASPNCPAGVTGGEEVGRWAIEAELSIVLDNVPYSPTDDETVFVAALARAYGAPKARGVFVLGGAGQLLKIAQQEPSVVVEPLSREETAEYASVLAPGANGAELYRVTGGTLLLLDVERRMRNSGRSIPGTREGPGDSETLVTYLIRLEHWLSPGAREAALRLALFPSPLETGLVEELVVPDLRDGVRQLVDVGLAASFDDAGVSCVVIPERKSQGIRDRAGDVAPTTAKLARIFADQYDREADDLIRRVASQHGGSTYLKVVQRWLAESGWVDIAVGLPLVAQDTGLPAIDVRDLLAVSLELLAKYDVSDSDVALAASRAAVSLGDPRLAEDWLKRVPPDLDTASECRRLALRAEVLKDGRQADALTEILQCFAAARQMVEQSSPDERADLETIKQEIAIDSLPAALFLGRESAADAAERLAPILPTFSPKERARVLATLAEREMKQSAGALDWERVAEWVTVAASLLDESDDRVRSFVLYQQAQYLRRRPQPRLVDARRAYAESRAAASRAGEFRREGLALFRLTEIERDYEERPTSPDWSVARLREIDDLAVQLRQASRDALSMRVLGRLQSLAALLEVSPNGRRDRLNQAAEALTAPVLAAEGDDVRFASVCVSALEMDLSATGDFLLAQRFLSRFRFEIVRRLGVGVTLDRPEVSRNQTLEWLATHAQEGRSDG